MGRADLIGPGGGPARNGASAGGVGREGRRQAGAEAARGARRWRAAVYDEGRGLSGGEVSARDL
jgi:hypothetical protein